MEYTELHCHSFFSFLDGTSSPANLAEAAARLQLKGLALTDDNGLYGVIPFIQKCSEIGLPHIIGSLVTVRPAADSASLDDKILLLCENLTGYENLSQLITRAYGADIKSEVGVTIDDVAELSGGLICLVGKNSDIATLLQKDRIEPARVRLDTFRQIFSADRLYVELNNHLDLGDVPLCKQFCQLAQDLSFTGLLPPTACAMQPDAKRDYTMYSVVSRIKPPSTNLTRSARVITNAISSLPKRFRRYFPNSRPR